MPICVHISGSGTSRIRSRDGKTCLSHANIAAPLVRHALTRTYAHTHTRARTVTHAHTRTYADTHTHICTYAHTHIRTHMHLRTHMHTRTCACPTPISPHPLYAMHSHAHTLSDTRTHMHARTTNTHAHMHTDALAHTYPARQARLTRRVSRRCNSSRREDRVQTLSFMERELPKIKVSAMPRGMHLPYRARALQNQGECYAQGHALTL